jgi:hypothetical protein
VYRKFIDLINVSSSNVFWYLAYLVYFIFVILSFLFHHITF